MRAWPSILLLAVGCHSGPPPPPAADVVIEAKVYTGNPQQPWAEAVAIRNGLVIGVGSVAAVASFKGANTQVTSLPDKLLLPGFHDGHVHPMGAGRQEQGCSLAGLKSVEDIKAKVAACAAAEPGPGWIVGRGWNLSLFPQANPNKSVLDAVVADRPVYLRGEDGHSAWLNSKGLAVVGITRDTKNPSQGVIERDDKGDPSGTLRESATDLVTPHLPERTLAMDVEAMRWAQQQLFAVGITSIMDGGVEQRQLEGYQQLEASHELLLRVVACTVVEPREPSAALKLAQDFRARFSSAHVRPVCAKIYLDGVLEGATAALVDDYSDRPGFRGSINATQAQLNDTVSLLVQDGFAVHMHVVGDAAVRAALDAYQHAGVADALTQAKADSGPRVRHTLAHLQLVHPDDMSRFAKLGVFANAQSLWAYPDTYIVDVNTAQVGQARVDRMYPWGDLQAQGAVVVGGSDWPVSVVNPLAAMEVMVRRADPSSPADTLVLGAPQQRLTLVDAMNAYTTHAAQLVGHDDRVGMIKTGMRADLVALNQNIFGGPATSISEATVWATWIDGVVVHQTN